MKMEERDPARSEEDAPPEGRSGMTPTEEREVSRIFYNPCTGFNDSKRLSIKVQSNRATARVKGAQIRDWHSHQEVVQVHRPERRPKVYNSIVGEGPGKNLQMDFMIYRDHSYNRFKYVLCVIDVTSRFAWAFATTNRKAPTYTRLFEEEVVDKGLGGVWPKHLNCDNEFIGAAFASTLKAHGVTVHFSDVGESNKNSIVERFIRTLRYGLTKIAWTFDEPNWPRFLPDLIFNYNNTYHTTIKAKPAAVFSGEAPSGQVLTRAMPDLKEGDRVRLVVKKTSPFVKGERSTLSKETYLLERREGTLWIVKDETSGKVYDEQPVRVKDIKKVGEVWTTARKEEERRIDEERRREREAEERPAPLDAPEAQEARRQEAEAGGDTTEDEDDNERLIGTWGPPPPAQTSRSDRLRRESALPPRLADRRKKVGLKRKLDVVQKQLGDYLPAGAKGEAVLDAKRRRTPSRVNRDLGYSPSPKGAHKK